MPSDYIPSADADFFAWETNFVTYANANLAALGLVAGDLTAAIAAQGAFEDAFLAIEPAQAALAAALQLKNDTRAAYETLLRSLAAELQISPAVSDAERQALGLPVRDKTRTPVATPTTRPVASVNTAQRLRHEIAFADEGTPTKKAKPKGVLGAEIYAALTAAGAAAPADPSGYTYIATDTRTPYVIDYGGADAGKTAHYLLRWVNTRGIKGPWSETASATVGG